MIRGVPPLPTHIYGTQRDKFAFYLRSILHPYLSSNSDLAVSAVQQFKRWLSWPLAAYAFYVVPCIVWTVSVYESVCLFPSVWLHKYSYSLEHNNAELSYSGLQNTAIPHKQQQRCFEYCMFVYCREVSDLAVGFEVCMRGSAILEKRRFVYVATKWTHSSNYRGSFLVHSPQRGLYVHRETISCCELM